MLLTFSTGVDFLKTLAFLIIAPYALYGLWVLKRYGWFLTVFYLAAKFSSKSLEIVLYAYTGYVDIIVAFVYGLILYGLLRDDFKSNFSITKKEQLETLSVGIISGLMMTFLQHLLFFGDWNF